MISNSRRYVAVLFVLALLGAGGWMGAQSLRPDTLVIGATLPEIAVRTPGGPETLRAKGDPTTIVLLFHSRCGHCHVQLDRMSRDVANLKGARIYLLTTEDTLPSSQIAMRWSALSKGPQTTWATVSADDFRREFGVLATPAVFVFDRHGKLVRRFVGETRVDLLDAASAEG